MKRLSAGGFTIVETLIVLAVSGVLFVSTVAMVAGQQTKAQFKASMTDIVAEIEQLINETATGSYPSNEDFGCISVIGLTWFTYDNIPKGKNDGCVFMGRAMIFGVAGSDMQQYTAHTLVATRNLDDKPRSTMKYTQALYQEHFFEKSEAKTLQYGTRVAWMRADFNSMPAISGFAIVIDPGQATMDWRDVLRSGTTTMRIIAIPGSLGQTVAVGANNIKARFVGADPSSSTIELCLNGGNDQSGLVTISGDLNASVALVMYNRPNCP